METLVSYEFTGILISAAILVVAGVLIGLLVRKLRKRQTGN